jgi:Thiopurine S-methyltransferase (TPMT)
VVTADWQRRADQLAAESLARGEPVAWFERLFAEGAAGTTSMPWNRRKPHPLLADWAVGRDLAGPGRAVVPGCGLGADAAFLAGLGLSVTGFDVSATAVDEARRRFPGPDFRQADLFAPAPLWLGAFDLVVEIYTVQALPRSVRSAAAAALRYLVAPGGTLLVVQAVLGPQDDPDEGPPWPLTRPELDSFAGEGLEQAVVEIKDGLWRAEFCRAAD